VKDEGTPTDATLPVDPTTMGASTAPARSVGRFVVLDVLGQGAMGLVLAAYDPDLDRKVAVKLLRPDAYDASSRDGRERMLREARALAKLSHPNVITIHEVGTVDDRVFLAMEFAPGGTLRSWLSAEKRPWREVLVKLMQAGRGLAAAHDAGLVHRDFKPANVLIAQNGEARVADFGLVSGHAMRGATSLDGAPLASRDDIALTHSGALVGTPAYMAPEQHAGDEVGPAADQFAFCVSAWDAIHGAPPFEGATLGTLGDNVRANRVLEPPAGTDVPVWVRSVLRRGLSVKPADRWPTMHALVDELARDPEVARRRRVRTAITAGLAMVFVAGTTAFALTRTNAPATGPTCDAMDRDLAGVWDPARASAVRDAFAKTTSIRARDAATRVTGALDAYTRDWVRARETACEATHVHGDQSSELLDLRVACLDRALLDVDALVDRFIDSPTPGVVDKSLAATLRLPALAACEDTDAMRAVVAPPADSVTRARVAEVRSAIAAAKSLGEVGQAKVGRERAIAAAADAVQIGYAPLISEALAGRARLEQLTGDFDAAEASYRISLDAAADAHDDRTVAIMWGRLLQLIAEPQHRPVEALHLVPALETAIRRVGRSRDVVSAQQATIARVLVANGKFVEGKKMLDTSLAMRSELFGPQSFEVAQELGAIGNVLQDLGKQDESIAYLERALAIYEKTFGPEHPDVIGMEGNIANAYESKGSYAEAVPRHRRVLEGFTKALGAQHPKVGGQHVNLANALSGLEKFDEAVQHYEHALQKLTAALGPDHANVALVASALSGTYWKLKRYDDALRMVDRGIAIFEALDMTDNPQITYALETRALLLRDTDRAADAIAPAERSMKIRVAAGMGPEPIAAIKLTLGGVLLAAGKDRPRGLALVTEARAYYATLDKEAGGAFVDEADAILGKHKR
jgi:tetratricopeptide (TPR) repeat protein/tRNA A-37 threonylcarbamoyl transferase component Bud32